MDAVAGLVWFALGVLVTMTIAATAIYLRGRWRTGQQQEVAERVRAASQPGKDAPAAEDATLLMGQETLQLEKIRIECESGQPLLTIEPLDRAAPYVKSPVPISTLGGLANVVIEAARVLPGVSSNLLKKSYVLVFDPAAQQALAAGSMEPLKAAGGGLRAIAVDASGRTIAAHGRLFPVGVLNPANVTMVVWQVLTIVTSQKHLADIRGELSAINGKLDAIFDFLKSERRSELAAGFESLVEVLEAISSGKLTLELLPPYQHRVDKIALDARATMYALDGELEKTFQDLEAHPLNPKNAQADKVHLSSCTETLNEQFRDYAAAIIVSSLAAETASYIPALAPLSEDRLSALSKSTQSFVALEERLAAFVAREYELLDLPTPNRFKALFTQRRRRVADDLRKHLSTCGSEALTHVRGRKAQLEAHLDRTCSRWSDRRLAEAGPAHIEVIVDSENRIEAVHRLLPMSAA